MAPEIPEASSDKNSAEQSSALESALRIASEIWLDPRRGPLSKIGVLPALIPLAGAVVQLLGWEILADYKAWFTSALIVAPIILALALGTELIQKLRGQQWVLEMANELSARDAETSTNDAERGLSSAVPESRPCQ